MSLTQGSRDAANPGLSKSSPSGNGIGPRRAVVVGVVLIVLVRAGFRSTLLVFPSGGGLLMLAQRGGHRGPRSRLVQLDASRRLRVPSALSCTRLFLFLARDGPGTKATRNPSSQAMTQLPALPPARNVLR